MTRPHPVVGISTKLSNALWRVSDKADVAVVAVDKQVKLILVVEGFDLRTEVRVDGLFFFCGTNFFPVGCNRGETKYAVQQKYGVDVLSISIHVL